jgi:hypothetical protein
MFDEILTLICMLLFILFVVVIFNISRLGDTVNSINSSIRNLDLSLTHLISLYIDQHNIKITISYQDIPELNETIIFDVRYDGRSFIATTQNHNFENIEMESDTLSELREDLIETLKELL